MPKVSVIVPVYNTEKYLQECVDSILNQTLADIEVLLVDDGSTDGSPALCDRLAQQDARVRCIHQENAGVSAARNRGLEMARGEYVGFVDSDDWLEADMYERLLNAAKADDCELVICDCLKEFDTGSRLYTHELPAGFYNAERMRTVYFTQLLMPDTMEYPVTISNSLLLIRKTVIVENKLTYPVGIRFSEDLLFGSEVGYFARSMTYLKGYAPYHYRQNQDSATHTECSDKWQMLKALWIRLDESFRQKTDYDFIPQLQRCMLFFVYMAMNKRRCAGLSANEFLHEAGAVLDDPLVRETVGQINVLRLNIPWKLKIVSLIYQKRWLRLWVLLLREI